MPKKPSTKATEKRSGVNSWSNRTPAEVFARAKKFGIARAAVSSFQVVVRKVDDRWSGHGLELPHVQGEGETAEKCVANTREAMVAAVVQLLESGKSIPAAEADVRSEQVFIRLTKAERLLLSDAAARRGFKRLSDFIRAVAVESARQASAPSTPQK